jgi:molybdopterin-guanine dinucleotide biosynthesis protein A
VVSSIVLAGGKGSRLGRDKALELIGDRSLIQRVMQRLMLISEQILIVGSPCRFDLPADCSAEYKQDLYPGKGPLGGIYTGLIASKSFYNLVVACDMPFLNVELLRYLIKLAPGFDAVVPRLEKVQPLHAVYSKSCLNDMRTQLENKQLGVTRFLNTISVKYVEQAECQSFGPQFLSFFNINSREDLAKANRLVAEGSTDYAFPRKE